MSELECPSAAGPLPDRLSRRDFIKGVGGGLLGSAVAMSGIPWPDALASSPGSTSPLDREGPVPSLGAPRASGLAAGFSRYLNRRFLIQFEDEWVASELVEVSDLSAAVSAASPVQLETVSLMFRAPTGASFGQGTYRVRETQMGLQDLFLVPVDPADDTLYEAVFNRVVG